MKASCGQSTTIYSNGGDEEKFGKQLGEGQPREEAT